MKEELVGQTLYIDHGPTREEVSSAWGKQDVPLEAILAPKSFELLTANGTHVSGAKRHGDRFVPLVTLSHFDNLFDALPYFHATFRVRLPKGEGRGQYLIAAGKFDPTSRTGAARVTHVVDGQTF